MLDTYMFPTSGTCSGLGLAVPSGDGVRQSRGRGRCRWPPTHNLDSLLNCGPTSMRGGVPRSQFLYFFRGCSGPPTGRWGWLPTWRQEKSRLWLLKQLGKKNSVWTQGWPSPRPQGQYRVTYRCPVTRNETAPLLLEILEERRDRHMEGEGGKSIWTPSLSSTPCALFMVKYLLFSINFANITTSSRKLKRSKDDNEDDEKYV